MHVDPDPPWSHRLPHAPGPVPPRADVVVLGGGWPGLVAAAALAQGGAEVLVLEAAPALGGQGARGPALAAGGLVEHAWRLAASLGDADAALLHRLTLAGGARLTALSPPAARGATWAAVDDREAGELARSVGTLQRWGVAVVSEGPDPTARRLGAAHLAASAHFPDEALLDPVAVTVALADLARQSGASLRTGHRVVAVGTPGDTVRVRLQGGAEVTAEAAVLAAEAGLPSLDPWLADALTPARETAILLACPATLPHGVRMGFGWTTARPVGDAHLMLSGCRWASPHLEEGETDPRHAHPAVLERLGATARRFFPSAGDVVARWSWISAVSCDGLPLIGPYPGNPRLVVCAGFGGLEATLGAAAGAAVAEGLLTGRAAGVPDRLTPLRLI